MKNNLLKIIDHFGISSQQRKLQEEVFELQEAITIFEEGNLLDCDNICEELADVMILLRQIFYYYNLDKNKLKEIQNQKIKRTLERIESRYYE